jgi:hypothetical protein
VTALAITPDSFDAGLLGLGPRDPSLVSTPDHQFDVAVSPADGENASLSTVASKTSFSFSFRPADSSFFFPAAQGAKLSQADVSTLTLGLREFRSLGSGKEEGRVCRTERERERGQPALKGTYTLSQTDLDLYEGDVEGADREIRRLQREGVRLFGMQGR